jgi:hypothetical protein
VEDGKKIKRIWIGESALQVTMADLLSIWSVAGPGAKYCNPYAEHEDEKKVDSFKALANTWNLAEVREWHQHLGDFWGPIVLHFKNKHQWMPIAMAFDTGYDHGFCVKSAQENIEHWRRGPCDVPKEPPIRKAFLPLLEAIKPAYTRADFDFPVGIFRHVDTSELNLQTVTPIVLDLSRAYEQLPLDPGESQPQMIQWVADFESVLRQNREEIMSPIQTDDPNLQERLEGMVDRMKNVWRVAKDDQKELWNEFKRQKFGNEELATNLIDVICSFESRWIPHEHCACPICWEGGLSQKLSNLPDFVNHMKNTHHIGWKNVKDYWCMIFTRARIRNANIPMTRAHHSSVILRRSTSTRQFQPWESGL